MERYVGYGNIASNLILHNHILYSGKSSLVIVRGKELKAVNILEKIYNSITEAKSQLKETKSVLTSETRSEWSLLMKPGIFKAVIIGVCIAILGQFMGVNAVLYYALLFLKMQDFQVAILFFTKFW